MTSFKYENLSTNQQLRVALSYMALPDGSRSESLHKSLKYANKWVAWNRPFDDFPLFKQAAQYL